MSYSINPVVLPDFGATWQRGQAFQQQQQQNALAQAMAQRQYDGQVRYENALARPEVLAGLTSADPTARQRAYTLLATEGGTLGFQAAQPLITQERQQAGLQDALSRVFGGQPTETPSAPTPPMAAPQAPGAGPAPAGATPMPAPAGDVRQRNAQFAALRERVLNDQSLTPPQREAALAQISAAQAGASGLPTGAAYRGPTPASEGGQWDAGIRPATGAVPVLGGAPGAGAPTAPRPTMGPRIPTTSQLFALMATGNPQAMELASKLAPLVAQANPNFSQVTVGGQAYMVNPQNPQQRIPLGPVDDVRDETRVIDGRPVQGQTVNGRFTPYPDSTPQGYRREGGRLVAEPGGPADQSREGFTRENQLRDEFTNLTKDFRAVQTAHTALQAAGRDPTPAGDLALLYQFNKLLDPNSVVRESEFATAARTGGLDDRVGAAVISILNGQRLTPSQRDDFKKQADLLLQSSRRSYDQVANQYRGLAERAGLRPEQIIVDFTTPPPAPRAGLPQQAAQQGVPGPGGVGTAEPPAAPAIPAPGSVQDGYRFKGGDPSQSSNWERVR